VKSARILVGLLVLLPGMSRGRAAVPPEPVPREAGRLVAVKDFDPTLLAGEIVRETNDVRVRQGLAPFKPEPRLVAAADSQAAMISLLLRGGHDNPLPHQGDPLARALHAGLPAGTVAENAARLNARNRETGRAYTYRELAAVLVQAWMDSPGHRANLLSPKLQYLGCGTRTALLLPGEEVVYAIQDFYTPAPASEPPPPAFRPGATSLTR